METLTNGILTIQVSSHGAELCSLRCDGREYLWQADPTYWARHSPVLFPIVGRVWNDAYRIGNVEYHLSQHGFARDCDFTLLAVTDTEVRYRLCDTEASRERYPYAFELEIGYRLEERSVRVMWQVHNPSATQELDFQIGAYPAFYYPDFEPTAQERGYFHFDADAALVRSYIGEKGCLDVDKKEKLELEEGGWLPLTQQLFGGDALVLEQGQVHEVTLCDRQRRPYITLLYEAPVVGLWSPPGKNAPFVCIEPWYGRCDSVGYKGVYKEKEWMQHLKPGETFQASYLVRVDAV